MNYEDEFQADIVDEQIDRLSSESTGHSVRKYIIHDIQYFYANDAEIFETVWHRLKTYQQGRGTLRSQFLANTQQKGNAQIEKKGSTTWATQSRWSRTISTLAAVLVMALLGGSFLILLNSRNHTSSNTAPGTPGVSGQTAIIQVTPTTPSVSQTSTPGLTQQYGFTDQDSGKTVTYTVTTRFQIILNQQKYPPQDVQVACTPPRTIGPVSNLPSVAPPLYAVRYMGIQPGTCTIKNGRFLLTVIMVQLEI
jgi:hypothetical protein